MANVTDYGALVAVGLIIGFLVYIIMNQKLSNVTLQLATLANQDTNVNAVAEDYKSSMQDTFRLLAKTAFDEAVAKADLEKESSFKGATTDLRKTLNNFNENINRFERESIARDTKLKSEISTVASLGIKLR